MITHLQLPKGEGREVRWYDKKKLTSAAGFEHGGR